MSQCGLGVSMDYWVEGYAHVGWGKCSHASRLVFVGRVARLEHTTRLLLR